MEPSIEKSRYDNYLICKERGHKASNMVADRYNICKFCGTYYYFTEPQLVEGWNVPKPPEDNQEEPQS